MKKILLVVVAIFMALSFGGGCWFVVAKNLPTQPASLESEEQVVATATGRWSDSENRDQTFTLDQNGGATTISKPEQLAQMAYMVSVQNDSTWQKASYVLGADIDLSAYYWDVPIGYITSRTGSREFQGSFNGNYHKITGVTISSDQMWFVDSRYTETTRYYGLFGDVQGESSVIQNFDVSGQITIRENPNGRSVSRTIYCGIISRFGIAKSGGGTRISNVNNIGFNINCALDKSKFDSNGAGEVFYCIAGGIIGRFVSTGNSTLENFSMTNCHNYSGSITYTGTKHTAGSFYQHVMMGGLIGNIKLVDSGTNGYTIKLQNCHNYANVNVRFYPSINYFNERHAVLVGGIVGFVNQTGSYLSSMHDREIVFEKCTNHGTINFSKQSGEGGIYLAGELTDEDNNKLKFSAVGGICGGTGGENSSLRMNLTFNRCINYSDIDLTSVKVGPFNFGGICGMLHYGKGAMNECFNFGDLRANVGSYSYQGVLAYKGGAGGILGYAYANVYETMSIKNCINYANIDINDAGSDEYATGGIVGRIEGTYRQSKCLEYCLNLGDITIQDSENPLGGLIGFNISKKNGVPIDECGAVFEASFPGDVYHFGGLCGRGYGPIDGIALTDGYYGSDKLHPHSGFFLTGKVDTAQPNHPIGGNNDRDVYPLWTGLSSSLQVISLIKASYNGSGDGVLQWIAYNKEGEFSDYISVKYTKWAKDKGRLLIDMPVPQFLLGNLQLNINASKSVQMKDPFEVLNLSLNDQSIVISPESSISVDVKYIKGFHYDSGVFPIDLKFSSNFDVTSEEVKMKDEINANDLFDFRNTSQAGMQTLSCGFVKNGFWETENSAIINILHGGTNPNDEDYVLNLEIAPEKISNSLIAFHRVTGNGDNNDLFLNAGSAGYKSPEEGEIIESVWGSLKIVQGDLANGEYNMPVEVKVSPKVGYAVLGIGGNGSRYTFDYDNDKASTNSFTSNLLNCSNKTSPQGVLDGGGNFVSSSSDSVRNYVNLGDVTFSFNLTGDELHVFFVRVNYTIQIGDTNLSEMTRDGKFLYSRGQDPEYDDNMWVRRMIAVGRKGADDDRFPFSLGQTITASLKAANSETGANLLSFDYLPIEQFNAMFGTNYKDCTSSSYGTDDLADFDVWKGHPEGMYYEYTRISYDEFVKFLDDGEFENDVSELVISFEAHDNDFLAKLVDLENSASSQSSYQTSDVKSVTNIVSNDSAKETLASSVDADFKKIDEKNTLEKNTLGSITPNARGGYYLDFSLMFFNEKGEAPRTESLFDFNVSNRLFYGYVENNLQGQIDFDRFVENIYANVSASSFLQQYALSKQKSSTTGESETEDVSYSYTYTNQITIANYYSVARFDVVGKNKDGKDLTGGRLTGEVSNQICGNEVSVLAEANENFDFVGYFVAGNSDGKLDLLSRNPALTFDGYLPKVDGHSQFSMSENGRLTRTGSAKAPNVEFIMVFKGMDTTQSQAPTFSHGKYQIESIGNLIWLSQQVENGNNFANTYFQQTADIDLKDATNFRPIGDQNTAFAGIYDGGGNKILGLNLSGDDAYLANRGLFGVTGGATIRNLTIFGGNVTGWQNVGALVGWAKNTNISKVNNHSCSVSVSKIGRGTYYYLGVKDDNAADTENKSLNISSQTLSDGQTNFSGIVGKAESSSLFACSNRANISKSANWADCILGGILADGDASCTISQSYTTNNVIANGQICQQMIGEKFANITDFYDYENGTKRVQIDDIRNWVHLDGTQVVTNDDQNAVLKVFYW